MLRSRRAGSPNINVSLTMVPLGMYCTVNAVAAVTTLRHVVVLLWVRFVAPAAAES